jgi:hypothetical protein
MRIVLVALIGLGLAACQPQKAPEQQASASPSASATEQEENHFPKGDPATFMGKYKVTEAIIAPWWDKKGDKPVTYLKDAEIEFTAKSTFGPGITQCEEAIYEVRTAPVESLFQGGLGETADPWKEAEKLGITAKYLPEMEQSCKSSTGDLQLQFAQKDADTLLLGLDNVIYTLKRVK